jgi:branched-subunit amino acid transport protein
MIVFIIWLVSFALLLTFFIAVDDASLPWIIVSLVPFFNTIVLLAIIIGISTVPFRTKKPSISQDIKETRKAKLKRIKKSKRLIRF